ncbi:hypothetical protein [Streptomyces luteogriseus]|uniref:hypothetical protein n=1 Tax=Streptomyces luteogriseus TaxID=68233 RepID=UPI0036A8E076
MDRNVSVGSGERLLDELVRAAQLASPAELPVVFNRYAEAMGLGRAVIYRVDIQQRLLVPFAKVSRNWSSTLRRPDGPTAPALSEWKKPLPED